MTNTNNIFQTDNAIFQKENYSITNIGVYHGGDAYLIVTAEKTALVDSGFAFGTSNLISNIKSIIGNRSLDYILLTHTHYDHASGSAYFIEEWPNVEICAGEHAAKIFAKDSAKAIMKKLNLDGCRHFNIPALTETELSQIDKLRVDRILKEDDIIDLVSIKLKVINAPGHTRCSIAFYCEEEKLLLSSETMGVDAGDSKVIPCFLVGYKISMDFVNKISNIPVDYLLVPHFGIYEDNKAREFIDNSRYWNEYAKNLVIEKYKNGLTNEEIISELQKVFYTPLIKKIQPIEAFQLNMSYLVPMVLKEFGLEEK